MLKEHFVEWGIERKLKQREVRYILVLEHVRWRRGKGTTFLRYGKLLDIEALNRLRPKKSAESQ